ncbi:MAG TPA: signal recognition particle-docking protein FtsY [Gammaproteobacteria bacterium]|nr:signal recognition particle-docking protein FtsY [Gammaproteobacteria bacterium]
MFKRLREGIARTRDGLLNKLGRLLGRREPIDASSLEALESALLMADTGVAVTERIMAAVEKRAGREGAPLIDILREEMTKALAGVEAPLQISAGRNAPFVILVVGVNGVGKTTTIAKLGRHLQQAGHQVMFAAGDTFRAAAVEQLKAWGERLGIPVIAQGTGADPASVIFDAYSAAAARGCDVLIADTAGRLHTQGALMGELAKIRRVLTKQHPEAPQETLLVLDATMGQNAVQQAKLFNAAAPLTGLALTKLDGTAKGGVVFAVADALPLPLRFIGVGEQPEDLQVFAAGSFVDALLGTGPEAEGNGASG